ncbi:hypothetical protein LR090_02055 [Candidatus Bipolaricaulota bacterium]|nr:hypothetical protein [Candidatus Bipolaricaulota bacterium]
MRGWFFCAVLAVLATWGAWGEEVTLEFPPPGTECPRTRVTFTTPVDMGVLGAESISGELLGGGDVLVHLESEPMTIKLERRGFCDDLLGEVYVQLVSLIGPVRPEAFLWRGGAQEEYAPFPAVGEWVHLATLPSGLREWRGEFRFRYEATMADPPGAYGVRLRFRVEYPELPSPLRELYRAEWEIMVTWSLEGLTVLLVHEPVYLGTIGPGIYDPEAGFGALEALENPVLVLTNLTQMVSLSVRAVSAAFPPDFSGGAEAVWQDLALRVDGGAYLSLGEGPIELGVLSGPGWQRYLIDYRYQVDERDIPGEYGAILEYTVTTP